MTLLLQQQQGPPQNAKKKRPLEYISVRLPRKDILDILDNAFGRVSANKARFYKQLQGSRRVQPEFHVTLIHRAMAKERPELWQKYAEIHATAGAAENKLGDCKVLLEKVSLIISPYILLH